MAKVNVGIPQGTRDFSAAVVRKRQFIFNTIRNVFELYGFEPLETPAMENLETLMGKYGEEGDKLIFKILNNGLDNPAKQEQIKEAFNRILEGKNNTNITERALRYDLTIPFARYVAMNHGQLTFPFKRYQIQPVWRADRPQKGRYREFYQCDADVVGSNSLLNEVELVNIYATVFEKLGIDVEIKINSRKILAGIAEDLGLPDKMIDIAIAIDKVDKIGTDGVERELSEKGFSNDVVKKIMANIIFPSAVNLLAIPYRKSENSQLNKSRNLESYRILREGFSESSSDKLKQGLDEIETILNYLEPKIISKVKIELSLARGLNYYTGTIFEIKANNVQMGSIGGGGRYDDLTGLFGVPNIPGVGISFGVDRIYDVMEELKLFPETLSTSTQVLFFNLGVEETKTAFQLMQQLRNNNIRCELFHETTKFDKQFKYAEKKNITYAVIIGDKELENNTCVIKNLQTSEQQIIPQTTLVQFNF